MAKRAAQEITIEHLLLTAKILRQRIQEDRAEATLTYKDMQQPIEELATTVANHGGKGLQALKAIIRHFRPIMAAYEASSMRELPPLEGPLDQARRVIGSIA